MRIVPLLVLAGVIAAGPAPRAIAEGAADAAQADAAKAETTEGSLTAKIGDESFDFGHLPKDGNYILKTSFGIVGATAAEGGARLQIIGMHQVVPLDGPFPLTLETEDAQAYFERHKRYLREGGERRLQARLMVRYNAEDGAEWYGEAKLVVTSIEAGRLVGTFTGNLRQRKGAGGPTEISGEVEVLMRVPAAGRATERAVTGE
jgi:hypothetical protein